MPLWVMLAVAGLVLVGPGLALALWFASARWNRKTSQVVKQLSHAMPREKAGAANFKDFEQLPAPVARYFRWALKEGQPFIRSARLVQVGEFRARQADNGWSSFDATQVFSAQPPGLVWDASIRMAPLVAVRVRDAYVAGQGSMQGKVLSLVSMIDERGKPELDAGALQRYLAEAVWFPTALLPREGLAWTALDDNRALATLTDCGTTVSLEFHFDETGEVTGVFTPGRHRAVGGTYELTPWAGHWRKYAERAGMRIPIEGEVEWHLPGGAFPYWKGRVVRVEYDLAQ
jgi:hypothetical protein